MFLSFDAPQYEDKFKHCMDVFKLEQAEGCGLYSNETLNILVRFQIHTWTLHHDHNNTSIDTNSFSQSAMHQKIEAILHQQVVLQSTVKIQAIARGWLARKQTKIGKTQNQWTLILIFKWVLIFNWESIAIAYAESIKYTKVIFAELVKTERQYISDLKTIINASRNFTIRFVKYETNLIFYTTI